jgi:PHD/YefM family antitoxin component YafN of YafNO toxin-antitoxin module
MIRIGESDFLWAFDAVSELAQKDPVTITKQGRDRLVVMSAEEYKRLRGSEDDGLAGTPAGGRRKAEAAAAR